MKLKKGFILAVSSFVTGCLFIVMINSMSTLLMVIEKYDPDSLTFELYTKVFWSGVSLIWFIACLNEVINLLYPDKKIKRLENEIERYKRIKNEV